MAQRKLSLSAQQSIRLKDKEIDAHLRGPLSERLKGRAQLMSAGTGQVRLGMDLASMLKPVLVGAAILFLVIGPGVIGLAGLLGSVSWYWWLAFLAIIILYFRK
ncbi:hypothetical protein GOV10_06415 [Candidatus Woesearchaeota archaeon]|nr:hypothetical protein [Candidatus Woesearchaeota archaeon]